MRRIIIVDLVRIAPRRYSLRAPMVAEESRVHAGRGRVAGDRHRLQHGAIRRRRRAAVQAAAGGGARSPGRHLHQRLDRLGHLQHLVVSRLPRPAARRTKCSTASSATARCWRRSTSTAGRGWRWARSSRATTSRCSASPPLSAARSCRPTMHRRRRGARWWRIATGPASSVRRPTLGRSDAHPGQRRTPSSASRPSDFSGMVPVLSPELWIPASASLDVEPVGMHDTMPSPTGTTRLDRRADRWL